MNEIKNETLQEINPEEAKKELVPVETYDTSCSDGIGSYLLIGGAGLGLGYLLAKAIGKVRKKKVKKELQQGTEAIFEEFAMEKCEGTVVEDSKQKKSDKR